MSVRWTSDQHHGVCNMESAAITTCRVCGKPLDFRQAKTEDGRTYHVPVDHGTGTDHVCKDSEQFIRYGIVNDCIEGFVQYLKAQQALDRAEFIMKCRLNLASLNKTERMLYVQETEKARQRIGL